jgi:hypothetical protein
MSGRVAFPAGIRETTLFWFGFASSAGPASCRLLDVEMERRTERAITEICRPSVSPSWGLPPVVAALASRPLGRVLAVYAFFKVVGLIPGLETAGLAWASLQSPPPWAGPGWVRGRSWWDGICTLLFPIFR